ncbi:lipid II:glycine glycyltransferase FemX [Methylobacterium nigriterrae]|uniref:lipid II:glycine glycyltransferase FemX n=1 Tax=Methylobacterium nigriterrae TaxID=3127512 RepID=UPI00301342F1
MAEVIVGQPAMWRAIAHHPLNSLFSSRPWTEAVARTYGFEVSASMLSDGPSEKADGALLFSQICDLRGERIVCSPFSDYCDPLAGDVETWRELVAPLIASGVPVTLRCLRNQIPVEDERFTKVGEVAWHGIDRPELEIWKGLLGPARQNIRKAERQGITIRTSRTLDDLHVFYRMHCHVRKSKYRLLPQPFAFFEQLHAAFADEGLAVLLAELDGTAVAGSVYLAHGDTLFYKFNASVDRAMCPNDLLVWAGIRLGLERGLKLFDFGASDLDQPGLLRFKRKFATTERTIVRLSCIPEGHLDPRAQFATGTLKALSHWLTDPGVPDTITQAASADFYRLFC